MQIDQISSRNQTYTVTQHSVLRNTYMLLSMTLLFSALCATVAVNIQAGFGSSLVASLVGIGLLFVVGKNQNNGFGIVSVFAFTGCMGYSMGPLLNYFIHGYANGGQLIATAMGGTGLTFLLSSAYIVSTKKDMSQHGKLLTVGLVVCLLAGLANIFLKMPAMQLAISTALTFISTMLMMYDVSRIVNNGETNYVMATVSLFLDIQMLFQNLLMLLGALNGRDR
jgi:modulator of FtsH protease